MSFFGRPYADLFPLVHLSLPAWGLLTFAPRWSVTSAVARVTALSFSGLYVALLGAIKLSADPVQISDLPRDSLQQVLSLFSREGPALAGWIHFVAFDLWTGLWMAGNAKWHKIPLLVLAPCMVTTMLFGPAGLLMYCGARALFSKRPKAE